MYKVAIIGAGAAGIEAAKASLYYNFKTILIDKDYDSFGGVCLNRGCIPAKYYLNSSLNLHNLEAIYKKKNKIVESIKNPTLDYLKKKGVDVLWADVQLIDRNRIKANDKVIEAENIVIAVGSLPYELIPVDRKKVFFAEDIFSFSSLPQKFLIVGAGAVGLEIACILNNLKKDTLVIEKEDRIIPGFDKFLSSRLKSILERRGIKIKLKDDINNYNLDEFDMVLLAAGRRPNTYGLDIKGLGLVDNKGWVCVNEYLRTNIENVYAVGDITGDRLLAYAAEEEARVALENIGGSKVKLDFFGLAECVFTQPQLACVGLLEEEAKKKNIKYHTIKSNFLRFSSSYVYSDTDGFIEVLFDDKENILGAGIVSRKAAELISLFSLAIKNSLKLSQLKKLTLIHPTLSEIVSKFLKPY